MAENSDKLKSVLAYRPQSFYELLYWQKDLEELIPDEDKVEEIIEDYLRENPGLSLR